VELAGKCRYVNGTPDIDHWEASPARAKTLAGLPPAMSHGPRGSDPLRDGKARYAARLRKPVCR